MAETSQKSGSFLSDETVIALVKQKHVNPVFFAAIDCNWGPPVSGRADADYFNLWVAVQYFDEQDKVFLQGARFDDWSVEHEMKLMAHADKIGIYQVSLHDAYTFPNEFVVRLNKADGGVFYDNNSGNNFRLEPYRGHYISAVQSGSVIFSLDNITPVKLFRADV